MAHKHVRRACLATLSIFVIGKMKIEATRRYARTPVTTAMQTKKQTRKQRSKHGNKQTPEAVQAAGTLIHGQYKCAVIPPLWETACYKIHHTLSVLSNIRTPRGSLKQIASSCSLSLSLSHIHTHTHIHHACK